MKTRLRDRARKVGLLLLSVLGLGAVVSVASCTTVMPRFSAFSNAIPGTGSYQQIYDRSYAFLFVNDEYAANAARPVASYAVSGTGWLFDFQENPANNEIVCYFGTNLHVADGLYNNETVGSASTISVKTREFYMGKTIPGDNYDIKYVKTTVLPTTQYSAIDFLPTVPNQQSTLYQENFVTNYYVDFAVLKLILNLQSDKTIYDSWIKPSIDNLKNFVAGLGLTDKTQYADGLFPTVKYASLSGQKAFVGGYPFYEAGKSYFLNREPITGGAKWTINLPVGETDFNAAPNFDYNRLSNVVYGFPTDNYGFYHPEYLGQWQLQYRDKTYEQVGVGLVIQNSNLAAGSSGSMIMNQNGAIKGIYFGTFSAENGAESPFGLGHPLRIDQASSDEWDADPQGQTRYVHRAYDLIAGDPATVSTSYKSSLGTTSTWLFN